MACLWPIAMVQVNTLDLQQYVIIDKHMYQYNLFSDARL